MWKSCRAALGALLLSASALAQSAAPVLLDPARDDIPLAGHLEWLEDPSTRMTLAEVQAAPGWTALPGMPNAGFTQSAIWLRLTLVQPAAVANDWRLSIDDTMLDEAHLYNRDADGRDLVQRAGSLVPRATWPLATRIPTFRLRLPDGEQTIYIRLQSRHTLAHPLRLYSVDGFLTHSSLESLAFGGYFGIFAVAVVLQLVFLAFGREIVSAWYLLYTLVLLTVTLLRSGYPQLALSTGVAVDTHWILVISILAPGILVRLSAVWLELHRHLPRLNRIYQGSAYTTSLACLVLALTHNQMLGLQLSQLLSMFWLLMSMGLALWLWRRRLGESGHYVLVFGAIDVGVMVRFLHNLGTLPVGFLTYYAIFIGTAVHLLLMSLYFIQRYNRLRTQLAGERRAREEQQEFVGMVSHEFRTPLAIINTSIQQLSANLNAPAERSLQRAQNIRNAVQRMSLLLDDYLSMDRLDSAHQSVQPRPCDFLDVIEDAASDWPLSRVRLQWRNLPPNFVCDPDLMRIVLRNLLANAVRHSPEGSPVELEATGDQDGGVRVCVQDRGEGIPANELPRLFQKYFRGRAAQGTPGAGLGLYLVKRIVEGHGGTIEVHSTPGAGTVFTLQLPAGRAPQSVNTVSTPV